MFDDKILNSYSVIISEGEKIEVTREKGPGGVGVRLVMLDKFTDVWSGG